MKGIVRASDKENQERDVRDEDEIERHEMNEGRVSEVELR